MWRASDVALWKFQEFFGSKLESKARPKRQRPPTCGPAHSVSATARIDVRRLVFPLYAGTWHGDQFTRCGLAGTGFFITRRGLALTAKHVVESLAPGLALAAAIPSLEGRLVPHKIVWSLGIPTADIAVIRTELVDSAAYFCKFETVDPGSELETVGVPEWMIRADDRGGHRLSLRTLKGYVQYSENASVHASFPLPKGMSGAPMIIDDGLEQFVAGVMVGQSRGEQMEDQWEEATEESNGRTVVRRTEIHRIEYSAVAHLLGPYREFTTSEFGRYTLWQLIKVENAARST